MQKAAAVMTVSVQFPPAISFMENLVTILLLQSAPETMFPEEREMTSSLRLELAT